tara:strand:- start:89 stop:298 length:210 start_codon:yes stop_codon:yes gene_type:complete
MAANIETLLVRMAGVIKKKYNDEELSNYILDLNKLFLKEGYPKKIDFSADMINKNFYKNYQNLIDSINS